MLYQKNHYLVNQLYTSQGAPLRARALLLLSFLSLCFSASGQNVPKSLPDTFNNLVGYYQHLPKDYDANPSKAYPLLIFVHGVGELAGASATALQPKVLKNGPPKLIEQGKFPDSFVVKGQEHSFIVITPQFKVWPGAGDVHRLVDYLKKQLRVDNSRLYVTGLSMGGGVIWGAISEVPEKAKQYAASVVVCGAYDPVQKLANTIAANHTPVWALHNSNDPTVPVAYTKGWVADIDAAIPAPSPAPKITIFTSTSHDAWTKAYDPNYRENGMNVYEWMLQYTRGAGTTPPPTNGNKRITVPTTSGRQVYYPDAMTTLNIKAGDTLCLAAGDYDYIHFGKLLGTADKPIIIMNCGGLVRVGVNSTTTAASFVLSNSKYFKVEGTGDPNIEYGFDVNGTNKNNQKMFGFFFGNGSSDFDVHHAYIHDAGMFLQAKTLQQCGHPEWLDGAFVMRNVKIHHLLCRNSAWEGFYIGNTHYLWDDGTCKDMKSHHIENLEVYDNDLENTGSDGIQISMADMGTNLVHHNRLVNYAMAKNSAHGYGILCGGGSTLRIYNNRVDKGYNCGIEIFGSGINYVYNNVITNIAFEGINVTDKFLFQPATGYIYNNTVYNTGVNGLKIYADLTTVGHKVYNNLVIAPGTGSDYPQSGFYIRGANPIKFDTSNNRAFKTAAQAFLEDPTGGNLRLTAKSPVINAGRDMKDLNLTTDDDDNTRPQGGKFDVGAYEYNGNTNIAPLANAGKDLVLTLPSADTTLDGSASKDDDGKITAYSWRKVSGPTQGSISSATSAKTDIKGLVQGTYVFELTVTDNSGVKSTDEVLVNVLPVGGNKAPNAVAGNSITLTLPSNSTQLYGSNSLDPDGVITTYLWKKISGPAAGLIAEADASNTNVTGLVTGIYIFELTVTDNAGATGTARQIITVINIGANQPPVANAGADITITLPANSVQLDGSASKDQDGSISSYAWKKVSGPAGETIATPAASKTSVTGLVAGTYVFELTVTDDKGTTATDRVTVTVNPTKNEPPVANAGNDISITLPVNNAQLDGSASNDPDGTIEYAWKKVSGPAGGAISTPTAGKTNITGLIAGTYVFELTVTDDQDATASDRVTVIVDKANQPPVANAGNDTSITLPASSVKLNGGASSDADGTITGYAWVKVSGPAGGTISSPGTGATNVTGLTAGTYVFELTVTDNDNAKASDRITITVIPANQPPVADAGSDISITLPVNSVQLDGSASADADGTITYAWKKVSGPAGGTISTPTTSTTNVTGLVAGTYVFQLTVTDNDDATASDRVTVTVTPANKPPVANAGNNSSITLPVNSTTLDGSASTDADGAITTYAWTKVSGPAAGTINSPGAAKTDLTGLVAGTYVFELTVTDDDNATATDRVTVVVIQPATNKPPTANAGSDINITLPVNSAQLDGSASKDDDGTITEYAWVKISGPAGGAIGTPNAGTTNVTGLAAGTYVFELTVTDNDNASTADRVTVTVSPAANIPPVAAAGTDITITLPVNSVQLDGSASKDQDGNINDYSWKKVSGPAGGTIATPTASITPVSGLVAGTYVFQLTVTDNDDATASDRITVTVEAAPVNQPPTANAGSDISITLPANSVLLDGIASDDPDGSITAFDWKQVSGPSTAAIGSPAASTTNVSGLITGTYVFELTVTDNENATATDRVVVTVAAAPVNQPPVANAGTDLSITLPVNTVQLDGSASDDPDGSISEYSWTKVSGPAGGAISSPNAGSTPVTGLVAGTYVFQLTVTDNNDATASDRVTITVLPEVITNQPPVAITSGDQNLQLPLDYLYVNGRSSYDPDGVITDYAWKQVSGPSQAKIVHPDWVETLIGDLKAGIYEFELKVTDNDSTTTTSRITITVLTIPGNEEPVAVTQGNQVIQYPTDFIYANGRDSHDADGSISTYEWKQVNGPEQAFIWHKDWVETRISGLKPGKYEFELTVTDNKLATNKTTFTVDVLADKSTLQVDSVSMFPNPAISFIRMAIRYLGKSHKLYFTIYDINGKQKALFTHPLTEQLLQKDLDISSLPAGYYLVEIKDETNEFHWTGKFLKTGN